MSAHTPGPWRWFPSANGAFLATPDRGMLIVMDCVRKGMNNAQPRFAIWDGEERKRLGGLMKPADKFGSEEIDHPDARLIAAAPDMLDVLKTIENDGKQVPPWLWDRIQAAIAKATGQAVRS